MMARLLAWWRMRTLREQRLLLVAGFFASVMILWFGLLAPLGSGLADVRKRHGRAVLALAEARSQAAAIERLRRIAPPALPAPLPLFAAQLAQEAGFDVARVEPQGGGGVDVTIGAARPAALFPWVEGLERRHGLVVDRFSARANSDTTLSAELSLRARGR
jgi:general secretion pathway protein M